MNPSHSKDIKVFLLMAVCYLSMTLSLYKSISQLSTPFLTHRLVWMIKAGLVFCEQLSWTHYVLS